MAARAPTPAQPVRVAPSDEDHDSIVVLQGASWGDFQRVLELRGDGAGPRLAFLDGRIELMSPSRSHEGIKSMIGCLIEAWCFERGIDITPYGSWTLEDKAVLGGVEPDECYVIGDVADPRCPDLAIEVVWTSGGVDKLEIYRRLGVREVWYWQHGLITIYRLGANRYEAIAASVALDGIDLSVLLRFIDVTPMTRAVRAYREALRG
ncbi:MAG: Uma2 family endonuclease [Myxococcales bacterium]|nr:Uma2 family endonuclease [Myxococcales bacterium]